MFHGIVIHLMQSERRLEGRNGWSEPSGYHPNVFTKFGCQRRLVPVGPSKCQFRKARPYPASQRHPSSEGNADFDQSPWFPLSLLLVRVFLWRPAPDYATGRREGKFACFG
jgi:hypothetical protein